MNPDTLRSMQSLSQEVWRLQPTFVNGDATMGDLAWSWAKERHADALVWNHRLWMEDDRASAWGWIVPPTMMTVAAGRQELSDAALVWQVHPDRSGLLDEVADWFESETPNSVRRTSARNTNAEALAILERRGYSRDAEVPWGLLNARELRDIEEPSLPPGYSLKTMQEIADIRRRVEVHRAAWDGSSLTEQGFTEVMSTWPYRDDLDFVVEAPDGSLAASAIGWYDEENRAAEFEPVGTRPEHRRLGLGRAMTLFGMHRFREAGATQAIVGCRGDADYPIPKLLYESVGFREISRDVALVKSDAIK